MPCGLAYYKARSKGSEKHPCMQHDIITNKIKTHSLRTLKRNVADETSTIGAAFPGAWPTLERAMLTETGA
jgi:hypothetical protein